MHAAGSVKDRGKPSDAQAASNGQAQSDIPALKPYWGKPAVRNFREGHGNVGIIRSPLRAIALPDPSVARRAAKFPISRLHRPLRPYSSPSSSWSSDSSALARRKKWLNTKRRRRGRIASELGGEGRKRWRRMPRRERW